MSHIAAGFFSRSLNQATLVISECLIFLIYLRQKRGKSHGAAAERGQDAEPRGTERPLLDLGARRRGCARQAKGQEAVAELIGTR